MFARFIAERRDERMNSLKLSVVLDKGFAYLETVSWDAFNEAGDLITHAKNITDDTDIIHNILADKIYRTKQTDHGAKRRHDLPEWAWKAAEPPNDNSVSGNRHIDADRPNGGRIRRPSAAMD